MKRSGLDLKVALLGATLPILLLLVSLNSVWPDLSNYDAVFRTNDFDYSSAVRTTEQLFGYFKAPIEEPFSIPAFSNSEASHLRDVKIVLKAQYVVMYSPIILWIVVLVWDRKVFWSAALCGGLAGFLLCLLLALIPFDVLFVWFHKLVFPQGNWIFERGQLMVTMYPERLFESLAGQIFTRFFALLASSVILGFVFSRRGS